MKLFSIISLALTIARASRVLFELARGYINVSLIYSSSVITFHYTGICLNRAEVWKILQFNDMLKIVRH